MMSIAKWIRASVLGGVAFAAGSTTAPVEAGAHCGAHANSCGVVSVNPSYYCVPGTGKYHRVDYWYLRTCSGTCYNNGTSGCCTSVDACANSPCKPGGCGSACSFSYSTDTIIGNCA